MLADSSFAKKLGLKQQLYKYTCKIIYHQYDTIVSLKQNEWTSDRM